MTNITDLRAGTGWFITKDYGVVNDCQNATIDQCIFLKAQGYKHKFKLLDDDGITYYSGLSNDDSSFAPLDEFAMPNAGCTTIQYKGKESGKFETL